MKLAKYKVYQQMYHQLLFVFQAYLPYKNSIPQLKPLFQDLDEFYNSFAKALWDLEKQLTIPSSTCWKQTYQTPLLAGPILSDRYIVLSNTRGQIFYHHRKNGRTFAFWQGKPHPLILSPNVLHRAPIPAIYTRNEGFIFRISQNRKGKKNYFKQMRKLEGTFSSSFVGDFFDLYIISQESTLYHCAFHGIKLEFKKKFPGKTYSQLHWTENTFYFGNERGEVYACRKLDFTPRWKYTPQLASPIRNRPFYLRGLVYVTTLDGRLLALDKSGKLAWKLQLDQGDPSLKDKPGPTSSVEGRGNCLYVSSLKNNVYCIDVENQKIKWTFKTNGRATTPRVYGNYLYFGTEDGYIYAVNLDSGTLHWKEKVGGPVLDRLVLNREQLYYSTPQEVGCLGRSPKTQATSRNNKSSN